MDGERSHRNYVYGGFLADRPAAGLVSRNDLGTLEFFPLARPLSIAFAARGIVSGEHLLVLNGFLVAMRVVQDYLIYPRLVGR